MSEEIKNDQEISVKEKSPTETFLAENNPSHDKKTEDKKPKKKGKIIAILISIVVILSAIGLLFVFYLIPESKYKEAMSNYQAGSYSYAYSEFKELGSYKNSVGMADECYAQIHKVTVETFNGYWSVTSDSGISEAYYFSDGDVYSFVGVDGTFYKTFCVHLKMATKDGEFYLVENKEVVYQLVLDDDTDTTLEVNSMRPDLHSVELERVSSIKVL